MTNDAVRTSQIMDTDQLYMDIKNGKLPAVSFVKPSGWVDGHPASSKWDLFEGFVTNIVELVQSGTRIPLMGGRLATPPQPASPAHTGIPQESSPRPSPIAPPPPATGGATVLAAKFANCRQCDPSGILFHSICPGFHSPTGTQ
jgi:hypothetical protein